MNPLKLPKSQEILLFRRYINYTDFHLVDGKRIKPLYTIKKYVFCFIILLVFNSYSFGQPSKIIISFNSTIFPQNGKECILDKSYSFILKKKYGISFEAIKITDLSTGECLFSTNINGEILSAPLMVKEKFPYEILDNENKYNAEITYEEFIPNKQNNSANSVVINVKVFNKIPKKDLK